jgi:hypothetical protein
LPLKVRVLKEVFFKKTSLEPVFKLLSPHLLVNFGSFFRKIFRNIPDIAKNFPKKSLKIALKSMAK